MRYILLKILHPLLLALMKSLRKYHLHILNDAPRLNGNAIYAVNHSNKHDMPIVSEVIGRHIFVLVGKQRLNLVDRVCFRLNGVIYCDRKDILSRRDAKKAMMDCIQAGQNICLFPEGTWNLTPSKPMLPLYWGIIDIAWKTGCPIVPIVLEYRGKDCYVKWGETIYVTDKDSKRNKIEELSDIMATMKWEIWEMFPVISRTEVCEDEWEQEVLQRLTEYPKLDYEYEQSCVRK